MKDLPHKLMARLTAYLMVEGSPWPIAIFRVILAASVCFESKQNLKRIKAYTPDTFHFPYFDAIVPLEPDQLTQLFELEFIFAVMLLIGFLTPAAAAGILITQGYAFLICQLNFRNHIYLTLLMTALVMLSPAWKALSVDSLLRWGYWAARGDPDKGRPPTWVNATAQRLIGLQVAIGYLYATLHKLNPGFLSGYPLTRSVARTLPRSYVVWGGVHPRSGLPPEGWLDHDTALWLSERLLEPSWAALVAYLTIFAEGFLAVGLVFKSTRLAAVFIGIGMHLTIGLSMDILTFGVLMVGGYVCFWMPRQRPIRVGRGDTPGD